MKKCNKCLNIKEDEDFYLMFRRGKNYLFHKCISCCSESKKKNYDYVRDWELKNKYGITLAEYKLRCLSQNGACALCGNVPNSLHVDHCHTTGKVRGLLCGSCNRALGLLKDNLQTVKNIVEYLDDTPAPSNT